MATCGMFLMLNRIVCLIVFGLSICELQISIYLFLSCCSTFLTVMYTCIAFWALTGDPFTFLHVCPGPLSHSCSLIRIHWIYSGWQPPPCPSFVPQKACLVGGNAHNASRQFVPMTISDNGYGIPFRACTCRRTEMERRIASM